MQNYRRAISLLTLIRWPSIMCCCWIGRLWNNLLVGFCCCCCFLCCCWISVLWLLTWIIFWFAKSKLNVDGFFELLFSFNLFSWVSLNFCRVFYFSRLVSLDGLDGRLYFLVLFSLDGTTTDRTTTLDDCLLNRQMKSTWSILTDLLILSKFEPNKLQIVAARQIETPATV